MTKEKIKHAAIAQFAKDGYAGAALSVIAKEVGIKTPSIYAFYKSKDSLFLSAFEDVMDEHFNHIQKISNNFDHLSTEEKLRGVLERVCTYHTEEKIKTVFLNRAMLFPPDSLRDALHDIFMREEDMLSDLLTGIFKQGIKEGTIVNHRMEDLLASYFCLLDGVFLQLFYYSAEAFNERVASSWKVFWNGVSRSGT